MVETERSVETRPFLDNIPDEAKCCKICFNWYVGTCEPCKQKREARKEVLKAAGLCTVCRKKKSKSRINKSVCAKCAKRSDQWQKSNKEKRKAWFEQWKSKRLGSGVCVVCGVDNPNGKQSCENCIQRGVQQSKELRSKRVSKGICYFCGIDPCKKGQGRCENCARKHNISRYVKMCSMPAEHIREWLDERHKLNFGLCAICRRPDPKEKSLCVDHDHNGLFLRDLLCVRCNVALGAIGDSPEIAKLMIAYIEHHNIHKGTVPFRSRA